MQGIGQPSAGFIPTALTCTPSPLLVCQEISQCYQGDTHNYADGQIPDESPDIAALQYQQSIFGKSGEGRKTTAQAHCKEQSPVAAFRAILAEYAPKKAYQETSHKVHSQRSPRASLAEAFHGQ